MQHLLYKTTNLLNRRFYIGVHSTENPDDGYLGSGRRIKAEINKYGRENFSREILEELPTREALLEREAELVTEELIANPLCLNLKNGGEGGGKIWNEEHRAAFVGASGRANKIWNEKYPAGSHLRLQIAAQSHATIKERREAGLLPKSWGGPKGRVRSDEARAQTKATMGERGHSQGEKNSQFGTCWVTNGGKPIKIEKDELNEYLDMGYRRGRK